MSFFLILTEEAGTVCLPARSPTGSAPLLIPEICYPILRSTTTTWEPEGLDYSLRLLRYNPNNHSNLRPRRTYGCDRTACAIQICLILIAASLV